MLELRDARGGYDKTVVIDNINLSIKRGERVALLGRNGVGKTTLLKYIMGLLNFACGFIFMSDIQLKANALSRARAGIGYVPQGRFVFERLSVKENIAVVAHANKFIVKEALDLAFLVFPALKEHENRNAGALSGGQQQMLSIARALSLKPKIMLLDEPSEGIQPSIVDEISKALNELSIKRQMTLIIAEQNIDFCMSVADRALIMDQGTIIKSCTKDELNEDKAILKDLLAI